MPEGTPDKPPPLEYAPRPGPAWIGRRRNLLILLALCFAIAAPTWRYWQSLKARAMWLYWSHRAAVHVMPFKADISVIGPEASRVATSNPDYIPYSPFKPTASTQPSASYNPIAFRELAKLDGRLRSMGLPDGPVIFMGTMHRPDGTPRLVIITGGSEWDSRLMLRSVGVAVLPLPGWFDPLPPAGKVLLQFGGTGASPEPAAYLSGTIDTRDSSHVVIPYTVSESDIAIIRRASAAARASTPGAPIAPISAAAFQNLTRQVIGEGEIDVHLQNDDSLSFAIRGPGQLVVMTIAADPLSLQQASLASQRAPNKPRIPGRAVRDHWPKLRIAREVTYENDPKAQPQPHQHIGTRTHAGQKLFAAHFECPANPFCRHPFHPSPRVQSQVMLSPAAWGCA